MAEELAASLPSATPALGHQERGTFPAGTALVALGIWFLLTRLLSRIPLENAFAARVSMFAGVTGAMLGSLAVLLAVGDRIRTSRGIERSFNLVRFVLAAPIAVLVASALRDMPPAWSQWTGLISAGATVLFALGMGIAMARGLWFARGALALLVVGELIELGWPPAHYTLPAETLWPRALTWAGSISEACAFVGAGLAPCVSISATARSAGHPRLRMFTPLPVFVSALLSMLATSLPRGVAMAAGEVAFGVRFDLAWSPNASRMISKPELVGYLLVPEFLLCAASISVAAIFFDRGAAARRALGWVAVLFAGFGAIRLSGPMDPIRIVLVCLAALLLEEAVSLEAADRSAPAFAAA